MSPPRQFLCLLRGDDRLGVDFGEGDRFRSSPPRSPRIRLGDWDRDRDRRRGEREESRRRPALRPK